MYSPATIKNYTNIYKKISENIGPDPTPTQVLEFTSDKSLSTQKSYLSAMIYHKKINNKNHDDYIAAFKKHSKVYNESYLKKSEDIPEWSTILTAANAALEKEAKTPFNKLAARDAVIATLYTNFPPLRTQEYFQSAYSTTFPDDMEDYAKNTIQENTLYSDGTFVLFDYKTARTHGTRVLHLPDIITQKIAAFHKNWPSNYILGDKYDSTTANVIISKILGVSCNQLRKSYVTNVAKDQTRSERVKLAHTMGHLLSSQELVYNKQTTIKKDD